MGQAGAPFGRCFVHPRAPRRPHSAAARSKHTPVARGTALQRLHAWKSRRRRRRPASRCPSGQGERLKIFCAHARAGSSPARDTFYVRLYNAPCIALRFCISFILNINHSGDPRGSTCRTQPLTRREPSPACAQLLQKDHSGDSPLPDVAATVSGGSTCRTQPSTRRGPLPVSVFLSSRKNLVLDTSRS